jgi:hypothetical protein
MAKLVRDDPAAAPEDLVLEVDRVEDARTVRQRLRIPAAEWREFLGAEALGAAPRSVEHAYAARREFWDWLAGEQADTPAVTPGSDARQEPVAPSAAWLGARFRDWQEHA